MIGNLSDIRILLSDFEKLNINSNNLILTENKMNFLALPALPSNIATWSGGGFMKLLKKYAMAPWPKYILLGRFRHPWLSHTPPKAYLFYADEIRNDG